MPTTVVNRKVTQAYDIYIGRPSKWGNPFKIGPGMSRAQVIVAYQKYLLSRPDLLAALHELKGKVLGCWCAPHPCHGDILAKLADGPGVIRPGHQFCLVHLYEEPCAECQAKIAGGL